MAAIPLAVEKTKTKGEYEIRSYKVKKLQTLGQGATLRKLLGLLDSVGAPLMSEGEALGYFNGIQKFRVVFKDDKPVAVHMKGETEDGESFNTKFGKKGIFKTDGGSRLNVQRRRTQRNRRNRKGRQLRKLTTRRR